MKRKICFVFLLLFVAIYSFSESVKYRYAFVDDNSVAILDVLDKIPEEKLNDSVIPMNTKQERFIAESGFRNFRSYFYQGFPFFYIDYTKNKDDPDMKYIESWDEVMAYVRGTK